MSAREEILSAIRRNRPGLDAPLPDLPAFGTACVPDRVGRFGDRLAQMGGRLMQPGPADDPLRPARALIAEAASVCSRVAELPGTRSLDDVPPASLHDVDLAVLRACFGVAETGSVALRAADLGVVSLGYLAQRLLVLLDPADIVETLHQAYGRPEFGESSYLVLQTGPSATADIEGVLIHGAQGVRALSVLLVENPG